MSDLPRDIEEEVLSRLPVTSLGEVRSTCKKWNTLTKGESFLKRHMCEGAEGASKKKQEQRQGMGMKVVMLLENRVSLMSVNLLYPSIEPIGNINADGVEISKIIHCDGLFLCITEDERVVVWNPYLGQTRWIDPRSCYHRFDRYALGYEKKKEQKKHKVLRFVNDYDPRVKHRVCEFEIYSLDSNSWKVVDVDPDHDWTTLFVHRGFSLKGNTYWFAREKLASSRIDVADFLICFDFETERFGPRLPLPFHGFVGDTVTLSSVREEQLAVLFQRNGAPAYTVKIWISTKIEPNAVSWSNLFLAVDMKPLIGVRFNNYAASFFVDEEEKLAVVLHKDRGSPGPTTRNTACILGDNGYFKQVDLGESTKHNCCFPLVSSYVPSSEQIKQPAPLGSQNTP
uniref:F-box/kelch-repeat protein n=1 Tax=Noccaea caerulescens TaxID=107243 RepID=A0A1J3CN69_NOCCA